MATGNEKVSAIRVLIAQGYEVSIREGKDSGITTISVLDNGIEVGYVMDKTISIQSGTKKKVVSAWDTFSDKVQDGWLSRGEKE
jgi:hypothetical protein